MITFLVTVAVTAVVSVAAGAAMPGPSPETYPAGAHPVGRTDTLFTACHWSPQVVKMTVLLLAGMAGMVVFWSYYFR